MRILYKLCALLFIVVSPCAFARGGPSGAFTAMLEWMPVIAVLSGIIMGSVVGYMTKRISWKVIILVLVVLSVIGMVFPVIGVFICIPLGVMVVLFATAYDVVTNGRLVGDPVDSVSPDTDGRRFWAWPVVIRSGIRWVAGTYLFWAVVSLVNIELLVFLLLPPAVFVFPGSLTKILPFVLPPLLIALGIGVAAVMVYYHRRKGAITNHYVTVFSFNACVLFSFFTFADIYREYLMTQDLQRHEPTKLRYSSFLDSVFSYKTYFRGPHASFIEEGKTYHWSYSERKFILAP